MGNPLPSLFKGIALFTPGGDLVYCIDSYKRNHWHLQLCLFLQELLGLPEPPHFLLPCFTATVDRWQDPRTQAIETSAEIYPSAFRYRSLLNAAFGCIDLDWQLVTHPSDLCDPLIQASYQQQFPQLWQTHDLIARLAPMKSTPAAQVDHPALSWAAIQNQKQRQVMQGYVLRLYVSGSSVSTERILKTLHRLLEEHLRQPYTLKVIDVRKHPEQAEADQVTATPTLVKVSPTPIRRIAGMIDQPEALIKVLNSFELTNERTHERMNELASPPAELS